MLNELFITFLSEESNFGTDCDVTQIEMENVIENGPMAYADGSAFRFPFAT